jgi:hypothetical protein
VDRRAHQPARLTPAFLLVGEQECGERGAEEEREDANSGIHAVRCDSLEEEASEMARRACGRDLVKIVKLRRGPGMMVKSVVAWECFECLMQDTRCGKC